jgi:hypothetical protein
MLTHSRDQRKWLKASLLVGVALVLFNSSLNCMASPVPQLVFHDNHAAHTGQQQSTMHTAGITVLDILGERPEFSKLLELIQKDKGGYPMHPTCPAPSKVNCIQYLFFAHPLYHLHIQI